MKVGVRAHDFGRHSADDLARIVKEAGFDCVQLAPTKAIVGVDGFDKIESCLDEIGTAFTTHNVEITVLGCYIEPSLTNNEERLKNVEIFKKNLTFAKQLGVKVVGTETTNLDVFTTPNEREKVYQILKDSILRMVEHAEKEGVYVGIEPVAEHTLNTPELTHQLISEVNSKQLKIIFDPVNLVLPSIINRQNEIYIELLRLVGHDIVAMHIKDIVAEDNQKVWRNIGEGIIDYSNILEWIRRFRPDMRLLREGVEMDSYKQDLKVMSEWT